MSVTDRDDLAASEDVMLHMQLSLTNCRHSLHVLQETRGLVRLETSRTACYSAIVDKNGECHFGVGEMDINDRITPKLVRFWPVDMSRAPGEIYYTVTYKPVSVENISVENFNIVFKKSLTLKESRYSKNDYCNYFILYIL
jgi:hypothetical protein